MIENNVIHMHWGITMPTGLRDRHQDFSPRTPQMPPPHYYDKEYSLLLKKSAPSPLSPKSPTKQNRQQTTTDNNQPPLSARRNYPAGSGSYFNLLYPIKGEDRHFSRPTHIPHHGNQHCNGNSAAAAPALNQDQKDPLTNMSKWDSNTDSGLHAKDC
jgi:hypothetical protein